MKSLFVLLVIFSMSCSTIGSLSDDRRAKEFVSWEEAIENIVWAVEELQSSDNDDCRLGFYGQKKDSSFTDIFVSRHMIKPDRVFFPTNDVIEYNKNIEKYPMNVVCFVQPLRSEDSRYFIDRFLNHDNYSGSRIGETIIKKVMVVDIDESPQLVYGLSAEYYLYNYPYCIFFMNGLKISSGSPLSDEKYCQEKNKECYFTLGY